ncbi:MAG: hypothetical protein VCA55_07805 [Verrucomicrobiales bacterium]
MIPAWVDIRPFFYVIGLPCVILLTILACRIARSKKRKWQVTLIALAIYTALFLFFMYGPFIGQIKTREYMMTWEIRHSQSSKIEDPEVILSFVDFPGHFIGYYSRDLVSHLKMGKEEKVPVLIEITADYCKVRAYSVKQIAGLKNWTSHDGYGGVSGSPGNSPWD